MMRLRCLRAPASIALIALLIPYSLDPSGALAFSVQGRVSYSVVGIGIAVFGAKGRALYPFKGIALSRQLGWLAHW